MICEGGHVHVHTHTHTLKSADIWVHCLRSSRNRQMNGKPFLNSLDSSCHSGRQGNTGAQCIHTNTNLRRTHTLIIVTPVWMSTQVVFWTISPLILFEDGHWYKERWNERQAAGPRKWFRAQEMKGNTYGAKESESIGKYLQVFSASFFKKEHRQHRLFRLVQEVRGPCLHHSQLENGAMYLALLW